MLAATSLQLHRPAVPLQQRQHARTSCGTGAQRSRLLVPLPPAAAAAAAAQQQQQQQQQPHLIRPRKKSHTTEPQLQLQAWLQQEQGLPSEAAHQHARRLAHIFGSQQAALDGLPATFEWCHGRGLTGLQTAQLLDHIAKKRRENAVQFAALVQPVWQQLESYIAAWAEQQRQAGNSRLRKNTSLAEALCSRSVAAQALVMPPGHVEAWLAAVSQRLPAADIGRLLLAQPEVVAGSPTTALAAISWAVDVLGVADLAALLAKAPSLLKRYESILQRNLDSLQQALGWAAQQARQLVLKQPGLLSYSPDTVQGALAWLRQLFPNTEQLAAVVDRGPMLLLKSVQHLQGNADYLRQALGWQDGGGQLAVYVAARPQDFAIVNFSSEETQHKLRLLSEVVGVSVEECLSSGSSYLKTRLAAIAAIYMLVQELAPALLCNNNGQLHLSWIVHANKPYNLRRLGMTRSEFNAL